MRLQFHGVGGLDGERIRPVDATRVPGQLPGFRTMFQAFHHLRPEQARAMLTDAMAKGEGVGVFESGSLLTLVEALGTPLRVLASPQVAASRICG